MRPKPEDHPPYFGNYINQVKEDDLSEAFEKQRPALEEFLQNIPADKWEYQYAPGKWTIKEMIQHCIDGERVFGYRAMCFARKEAVSLPSFDENSYAANSDSNRRNPADLIEEFLILRNSTELLFKSFTDEMLSSSGIANNNKMSVLSMGYTILGHMYHHMKVAKEKYLV